MEDDKRRYKTKIQADIIYHASEIRYCIKIVDALMDTQLLTNFTFIFLGLINDFVKALFKEAKSMKKAH